MKAIFKLHIDQEWEEYQVQVFENGKLNKDRTYHASDRQDTIETRNAMIKEEEKNQKFFNKVEFLKQLEKRWNKMYNFSIHDAFTKKEQAQFSTRADEIRIIILSIKENDFDILTKLFHN